MLNLVQWKVSWHTQKIDFADDLNWPSGCYRKKFKCEKFTDDDNNDGTQLNHVNSSHDSMNQVS